MSKLTQILHGAKDHILNRPRLVEEVHKHRQFVRCMACGRLIAEESAFFDRKSWSYFCSKKEWEKKNG